MFKVVSDVDVYMYIYKSE